MDGLAFWKDEAEEKKKRIKKMMRSRCYCCYRLEWGRHLIGSGGVMINLSWVMGRRLVVV